MPYAGLTVDSTTNGVDFITSNQAGLTATIADEVLQISGTTGRIQGAIAITSSQISVFNPIPRNGSNGGGTASISYVNSNAFSDTTNLVTLSRSSLQFESSSASADFNVLFSRITDSLIIESGLKGKLLVYVQPNAQLSNSQFVNVKWLELTGTTSVFSGISLINTYAGVMNYQYGRIDLIGISIPSTVSVNYVAILGELNSGNNSFIFWNPVSLDFTKVLLTHINNIAKLGYTIAWKIRDSSGLATDVLVIYRDDRGSIGGAKTELARYTTDSTGTLVGTYDSKLGATGSSISRPVLWALTRQTKTTGSYVAQNPNVVYTATTISGSFQQAPYTIDTVSPEIETRSYLHLSNPILTSIAAPIGIINSNESVNTYTDYVLATDTGITQINRVTALAVTGIAHTATTITISISRSIAEIYDSRKAYWRENGGSTGARVGTTADFANLNITIATTAAISPSTAKFLDGIQTAGIITLTDARAYNGVPFAIATGGSVVAAVGSTDLRTWAFATGTVINRSGSGSAIVTVAADQLANVTAGAGVTIQVPQATIRFFGIPNVSNAIISVQDLTTSVITYPTVVAGEVTITVNTARNYKVRADAPGYLASRFFTIAGTTPEFQFNLADYRSLYLSGVNRASQISFNPTTFVITITDATLALSFADVFRTIEDYLASQQGLAYTAHPFPILLPSKNLLWFPFDTTANAVNPARIKPATTNTSDPELLFETYLEGATDPTYGLFDFTGAGGRIIRIRSEVAIAQVQGDGSFTISDRTKLEGLNATLVSSGVFSAPSLVNAPAGGGGTADWTTTERGQIRKRLGIDGTAATPIATPDLALGSAISAIPTNPLLTTDTRLNNLDASVSSRLASAEYATPPTVAAITSAVWANTVRELTSGLNITLAKGTGITGLNDITAQSVLSVPTSSQITAGTIGKLFADNINAPISAVPTNPLLAADTRLNSLDAAISTRSTQSSVNAIPINPVLTSDSRLNFLDASIAANAPINVWNFATRTLTSTGSTLTASDVWNFATRSLTTPFPTVPSSTDNAIAIRTNLAIELARVDASITSRSSGSAIVAIDSKVDEIKTNTAGGDYVVL